ncbi:ATP-binding protein [Streptomyces alkaliterrae]|uniref:ATP-binding protein n=1 Tax=Streptomyces alkaliterrae TaxID=2213162 RepID=A0A5P0YR43_9ACTN|nr:ATP-binding protein [Streptomyces alkaliterrae]MBB1260254.1 ATP-binding protein [Streptomyces alkaliterrae]MQS01912.1 ATP-binding protein [Streptomyces alkaliterrae]
MRVLDHPFGCEGGYAWELVAEVAAVRAWREDVAAVVREWGADDEAVDVVRLGVSELLSNVCRHVPDRRCRLTACRETGGVRVGVVDRSARPPVIKSPDWMAEAGRGLWLLRGLAADVGYESLPGGKCVWFRVGWETRGARGRRAA